MKWPEASFSEVAEIVTGNTPPKKDPDNYGPGVPWVKPPDLDRWEPITTTAEYLSPRGQKLARLLPEGTVLVCCIGSIGRVGIAGTTLATNQQINSLIFGPKVEPRFGYYYCRLIPQQLQAAARNAVVPILNKSNFSKIKMPLPPLSEQRRIVEILDQADALRKKRSGADAKAARILPALFYKMFGDPVTNPMGWPTVRLSDYCDIVTGNTPSTKIVEYYGNGFPWARPADLDHQVLVVSTEKTLSEEGKEVSRVVPANSVLVVCIGATLGKVALAGNEMSVNQQINAILPNPILLPEFLYMQCTLLSDRLRASATKSTLPILNKYQFGQQIFVKPPIGLQDSFCQVARQVIELGTSWKSATSTLDALIVSLLHRAFTGELTAKWREAHVKELLAEMEYQAKALKL